MLSRGLLSSVVCLSTTPAVANGLFYFGMSVLGYNTYNNISNNKARQLSSSSSSTSTSTTSNHIKTIDLNQMSNTEKKHWLSSIDTFLFDCDGVIWSSKGALPGIPETIQDLLQENKEIL